MSELVFVVEEAPEGGYVTKAVGASIVTDARRPGRPARPGVRRRAATSARAKPPSSSGSTTSATKSLRREAPSAPGVTACAE